MSYVLDNWSFDPFLVVVGAIVVLHELGLRNLRRRSRPDRSRARRGNSLLFYSGLGVLLLAVASPIDYWASDYFFVHMIEHILIMFLAPILIVAGAPWLPLVHGLPVGIRRRLGRAVLLSSWARPLRALGRFVSNGVVAVLAFNISMVLWHIPVLFDLAERNQAVHIWLMHSSFFLAGVLFWLQLIPSYPIKPRLSTLGGIWAVLVSNVVMIILAMSLSILSSASWYSVYDNVAGVKLSAFADQQIGAAILWVCGDFWAYPILVILIGRAIREEGSGSALIDKMLGRSMALSLKETD
jgi:cytochrome c oxidase assembly factor CtaG